MVAYRPRHLESRLLTMARHFKAVLVTGARQVGKSTLLSHAFPTAKSITFDPVEDVYNARRDPDLFLDSFAPPLILDEIQYAPELLSALKRRVDRSAVTGQYLLSGSQQLELMRNVSESMAGRVGIAHLGAFTPAEMQGRGAEPLWLEAYLAAPRDFMGSPARVRPEDGLYTWLWRGSLPGLIDFPDALVPDYLGSYVSTYIERDVRTQSAIRDLQQFRRLVALAAALSAQEMNVAHLGREVDLTPASARVWLNLLITCHQWRELPAFSGNAVKRVSGKAKGLLSDSGLMCWLQRISSPDGLAASPLLGAAFETAMVNAVLNAAASMTMPPLAWHWRTNGGAEVDLLLERDGLLYPIEIKCKTRLSGNDLRGPTALRETYGDRVQHALVIYAGEEVYRAGAHVTALPWWHC